MFKKFFNRLNSIGKAIRKFGKDHVLNTYDENPITTALHWVINIAGCIAGAVIPAKNRLFNFIGYSIIFFFGNLMLNRII